MTTVMTKRDLQFLMLRLENKLRQLQGDMRDSQLRESATIEHKQMSMRLKEVRSMWRITKE